MSQDDYFLIVVSRFPTGLPAYPFAMILSLRKGHASVHVGYLGGWTDTLHAKEFTLQANEERLVLSVDLSPNERVRNKDSNCYHDICRLLEDLMAVKYFEFWPEPWLRPLAQAVMEYPDAAHQIEVRFKDGSTHRYVGELTKESGRNVIFNVAQTSQAA